MTTQANTEQATTETRQERYVRLKGKHCPECGHDDIQGGLVEIDAGTAHQEVYCPQCNAEWVDYYQLTHIAQCEGFDPNETVSIEPSPAP